MAFKFGLETVLKHRKRQEEIAQREFAEAQAELDQCLRTLDEMYHRHDQVREEIAHLQAQGTTHALHQITEMEFFLKGHRIRIDEMRLEARRVMVIVEEKQEVLISASREKKILEKLKDKKFEQHREWMRKIDAKIQDDQTMTRVVWRRK